eukprot:TRINITY_DN17885_c0_g1_i1.p1 TRINITY_DN17885_c0_g1~~TRINITY_DN17885_c0_g1_i1.p1  ORF type:complete len:130 (-),score=17.92 TRINITY_DN17885_c0_g1_i1:475-864(-)
MKRKQGTRFKVIPVTKDEIINRLEQELLDKDWLVGFEDVNNTGIAPLSTILETLAKKLTDKRTGVNRSIQNAEESTENIKRLKSSNYPRKAPRGRLVSVDTNMDEDFLQKTIYMALDHSIQIPLLLYYL